MCVRRISRRVNFIIQVVISDVRNYPDDLLRSFFATAKVKTLTDRVLSLEESLRKFFVDQNHPGGVCIVLRGIKTSAA